MQIYLKPLKGTMKKPKKSKLSKKRSLFEILVEDNPFFPPLENKWIPDAGGKYSSCMTFFSKDALSLFYQ